MTLALKRLHQTVSIHATLAGGDLVFYHQLSILCVSIHATLAGGDVDVEDNKLKPLSVSIHATLAGGDIGTGCKGKWYCVSIHATLAGGDELFEGAIKG